MGRITGSGRTGKNSTFKLAMPVHSLSFTSKVSYVSLWTYLLDLCVHGMDYLVSHAGGAEPRF